MLRRRTTAIVASAITALLFAGCGGGDEKADSEAFLSLIQAPGVEQVGDAFEVGSGGTTLGWQAASKGSGDKPAVLRITRETGPCRAPLKEACPKDARLREDVPVQEIELPEDGAKRTGGIAITTLKPGRRVVVTAELCQAADECSHKQKQTFRMAPRK